LPQCAGAHLQGAVGADGELPVYQEAGLRAYLNAMQNPEPEIARLRHILAMDHVVLEIGCGSGEVARQIALKNPHMGVIATDKFDLKDSFSHSSYYFKVAQDWQNRRLPMQMYASDNLVLLRADLDILVHIPDQRVDSILLVNSEPAVGKALMEFLRHRGFSRKIKTGDRQIVVMPFAREFGIMACGGYEFDHPEDWSRGLGYIMGSGFAFRKDRRVQWGVDLFKASPYSLNSTQSDVYVYGNAFQPIPGAGKTNRTRSTRLG
jgi:hypothetical protein